MCLFITFPTKVEIPFGYLSSFPNTCLAITNKYYDLPLIQFINPPLSINLPPHWSDKLSR